ncbi:hypothetical protein DFH06DRAFT_1199762 [Mycena polygramma]|nr:hypothetical protein DFH06DRAFT_1199762 [Mycena polygramma]
MNPTPCESPPPSAQKVHEPPEVKKPQLGPAPIAALTPIVLQPRSSQAPLSFSLAIDALSGFSYRPARARSLLAGVGVRGRHVLPSFDRSGTDDGWMADVKHERHVDLKVYHDDANVKLSTALDGVPEDKLAISFRLLNVGSCVAQSRSLRGEVWEHVVTPSCARERSVPHKVFVLRAGDYVHIIPSAEADADMWREPRQGRRLGALGAVGEMRRWVLA